MSDSVLALSPYPLPGNQCLTGQAMVEVLQFFKPEIMPSEVI